MMNSEKLMFKGALGEKKLARSKLATRADARIRALRKELVPAVLLQKLQDLKTAEILDLASDLHETVEQYLALSKEIADIERELE